MSSRPYELVLYGATGYTGKLASRYIAQHCPTDLKWAVGGRSHQKLNAVIDDIKPINVNRQPPGIIIANADDSEALTELVQSTRVVVSVAGPFSKFGSKLVQACSANGTHYADITGETPWIRQLIQRHHLKPASAPSILIPSCGFDSIPSDLGTYLLVTAMQNKYSQSVKIKNVRNAVIDIAGGVSGGTLSTAFYIGETYSLKELAATYKPFALSPIRKPPLYVSPPATVYDGRLGGWLGPWIMSKTNSAAVCRTYGLLGGIWGPAFSYGEYLNYRNRLFAEFMRFSLTFGSLMLKVPLVRWVLRKVLPAAGEGPTEEALQNGKLYMRIIAETDEPTPRMGSITVTADKDPAYFLTAMMLVEAGLVLVRELKETPVWSIFNEIERQSVVVTPALLGDHLRDRLESGGLHFTLEI